MCTIRDKRAGREGKKGEDGEREKMRPPPLRAKVEGIMNLKVQWHNTGTKYHEPKSPVAQHWHKVS